MPFSVFCARVESSRGRQELEDQRREVSEYRRLVGGKLAGDQARSFTLAFRSRIVLLYSMPPNRVAHRPPNQVAHRPPPHDKLVNRIVSESSKL